MTPEELENFNLKKALKKAGKGFKNLAKKIVSIVGVVHFAPLLPLAAAMLIIIKAKKIKIEGKGLKGLAATFYHKVIKGNFDYQYDEEEYFDPVTVTTIITTIVRYFKGIKKKGKNLTPQEQQAVESIGKAAKNLTDKAYSEGGKVIAEQQVAEQQSTEAGKGISTLAALKNPFVIGIAAVLVIIVIIALSKRGK